MTQPPDRGPDSPYGRYGDQPPGGGPGNQPPGGGYPPPGGPGGGYSPYPASSGGPGGNKKGFFGSLFDFSFSNFVTPSIIKVLYVLAVILAAIYSLAIIIFGFSRGAGLGILFLVGGIILFLIWIAFTRVLLEFYMAVFRIADDVQSIRQRR